MKKQNIYKVTAKKLTLWHGTEFGKLVMTTTMTRRPGVTLPEWRKHVAQRLDFEGFKHHGIKA